MYCLPVVISLPSLVHVTCGAGIPVTEQVSRILLPSTTLRSLSLAVKSGALSNDFFGTSDGAAIVSVTVDGNRRVSSGSEPI